MPNLPTIRGYFDLKGDRTSKLINEIYHPYNYPIHFSGLAVFAANAGSVNAVVSVDESPNSTVWTPVLIATPTQAGLLSVTIRGQSYVLFTFKSVQKYVRVKLASPSSDGVYFYTCQYPPVGNEGVEAGY